MKRIFVALISVLMIFTLVGCGNFALSSSGDSSSGSLVSTEDASDFDDVTQEDVFLDTDTESQPEIIIEESSSKAAESSSKTESVSSKKPTTATSSKKPESKPQTENHEKDTSGTVYVTPTGKRYHLDPDCGGKNSRASTLSTATARGLTPCKKCAQ